MSYFIKQLSIAIIIGMVWLRYFINFCFFFIGSLWTWQFSGMMSQVIPLLIVTGILLLYLWSIRCKKCGKIFTYRKVSNEMVNSKDIMLKVELNDYNSRHEVKGTHEQYITGTRNTYKICYKCKNCGNKKYENYSKDFKNV